MAKPLVSVLVPVYNAGEYLRPSIQSILSQTYFNLEILIINDGSTDGCMDTIADIKDSRVRIIEQENSGRSSAMNHGLDELNGDFYIAHDADDISFPCRVERQLKAMQENSDIVAVFVGHNLLLNGKITAPRLAAKTIQQCRQDILKFKMPAIGATPMYRMAMVGDERFETSLKVAEDVDYILRLGERYSMIVLPECLYTYRIHFSSSTRVDPSLNYRMERKVIERACQRRGLEPVDYFVDEPMFTIKRSHRNKEIGVVPHLIESVLDLRRCGQRWRAMTTAVDCLLLHPMDPYYYKPLVYFLAPLAAVRYYRSRRHVQR